MTPALGWPLLVLMAVTALAGLWLLWFGLWGDRYRARLRCPACWYDLSDTSPQPDGACRCPECGRISPLRHLKRHRRRWRPALLGLGLILGCSFRPALLLVQRPWWHSCVPTSIIIPLLGRAADSWPENVLLDRIREDDVVVGRLRPDSLWSWQRQWLVSRCTFLASSPYTRPDRRLTLQWIGSLATTSASERAILAAAIPRAVYSNNLDAPDSPSPEAILAAAAQGQQAVTDLLTLAAPNIFGDVQGASDAPISATRTDLQFDDNEGDDCLLTLNSWPLRQQFLLLARRGVQWKLCGTLAVSRPIYGGEPGRIVTIGRRPFLVCPQSAAHDSQGFRAENETWYALSMAGIGECATYRRDALLDVDFPIRYTARAGIVKTFEQAGEPAFDVSFEIEYLNSPALWEKISAPGVDQARQVRTLFTRRWTQRFVWHPGPSAFIIESWREHDQDHTEAPPEFGIRSHTFSGFVRMNRAALLELAASGPQGAAWVALLPNAWPTVPEAAALARDAARR